MHNDLPLIWNVWIIVLLGLLGVTGSLMWAERRATLYRLNRAMRDKLSRARPLMEFIKMIGFWVLVTLALFGLAALALSLAAVVLIGALPFAAVYYGYPPFRRWLKEKDRLLAEHEQWRREMMEMH